VNLIFSQLLKECYETRRFIIVFETDHILCRTEPVNPFHTLYIVSLVLLVFYCLCLWAPTFCLKLYLFTCCNSGKSWPAFRRLWWILHWSKENLPAADTLNEQISHLHSMPCNSLITVQTKNAHNGIVKHQRNNYKYFIDLKNLYNLIFLISNAQPFLTYFKLRNLWQVCHMLEIKTLIACFKQTCSMVMDHYGPKHVLFGVL
jgi:hypothetical protein